MKTIKYILSSILLLASNVLSAQNCPPWVPPGPATSECITANIEIDTIITPNYSPVEIKRWISIDWTQNTKDSIVAHYQREYGNRLILEAEATVKYNCHAWVPELLFSLRIMASILDVDEYPELLESPNRETITEFINSGWLPDKGLPIKEIGRIIDNYMNSKN